MPKSIYYSLTLDRDVDYTCMSDVEYEAALRDLENPDPDMAPGIRRALENAIRGGQQTVSIEEYNVMMVRAFGKGDGHA